MSQMGQHRRRDMLLTALGEQIGQLLADNDIIEIMLNPDGQVHLESLRQGKRPAGFKLSPEQGVNIIKLIASANNQTVDHDHPQVAAELPLFQARFQAWLPPVTKAPAFAIRKHVNYLLTLDDYVQQGGLTTQQRDLLREAVAARKNIIVGGGSSSGKTTFCNALLHELEKTRHRLFILEDLPELHLSAEDVVTLQTTDLVDMRALVKSVLRMRPDRIIIGEIRDGGATLELLKAWNTGHPGGFCTIHANSAVDVVHRIGDLLQEVMPLIPQQLIMRTVDLIVFMSILPNGQRGVSEIAGQIDLVDNRYQLCYY